MSLYLLQHRTLKLKNGELPSSFPAPVTATITFGPEDAFGIQNTDLRSTTQRARPARVIWNANEGISHWEAEYIEKVEATFTRNNFVAQLEGNQLTLNFNAESLEKASRVVASANQFLPTLLSFHLRTFVWIKQFEVRIAESIFNFEISSHRFGITIATAEHNRIQVIEALDEWLAADEDYYRIIAAFYYFRHAQRLERLEPDRQSMVAEVLLNLTKALEIIFTNNRDNLRAKTQEWGFDRTFIEEKIIPLFLIRNELDVAHVSTGPLTSEHRQVILDFTNSALTNVHKLLESVTKLVRSGEITLGPVSPTLHKDKEKLIQVLNEYVGKL